MWFQNVSKEKIIKSAVLHSWLIAIATEISKTVKPFFDMALSACTIDKDEMIHYQRSKHWREDLHTACLSIACIIECCGFHFAFSSHWQCYL